MAIQLDFTDQHGEQYATSYWKPVQLNLAEADNSANIVFYGYKNAANKGKRVIGQKSYSLDASKITSYLKVAPQDGTTVRNALLSAAYKLAKETNDLNAGTVENPNMVSFFNGGSDV